MNTNEKLKLFSESLRQHQLEQVEILKELTFNMAIASGIALVSYLLYKRGLFSKVSNSLNAKK